VYVVEWFDTNKAEPWLTEIANEQYAAEKEKEAKLARQRADMAAAIVDRPRIQTRTFTDKSGEFSVDAEYVEFRVQNSRVILKKAEDGSEVDVSFNDLSDRDQEWIRAENKRRAEKRRQESGR
jgi:hypothetical protein